MISISSILILPQKQVLQDAELRETIERLHHHPYLPVDNEKVHLPGLLIDLYQFSEFETIWKNEEEVKEMIELIGRSYLHGLQPDDYHYEYLIAYLEQRKEDHTYEIYFDILLSDAAFLYSHHIQNGRIDRKYAGTWNVPERENYLNYIEIFYGYVLTGLMPEKLEEMSPDFDLYNTIINEKIELYSIEEINGEFTWIPDQNTLRVGDTSDIINEISTRIYLLGYADNEIEGTVFTEELEIDVKKFQSHHGLEVDGIIGKSTFDMLNLTLEERRDLIDINLERLRWIKGADDKDMVVVNISGFHLYYFKDGELNWDTDVMTGAIDTQTPVFVSEMKYIVLNPTWTVPRSIITKSMFTRMKNDPTYLQRNNYYLVDQSGTRVDETSIDWPNMTLSKFNYYVVQSPGPRNALGRVKFIFPNQFAIYLHDTPSKSLFSRASRAFSHGCIRVKDPLTFAEILLSDQDGYSMEDINGIIEDGETKTVFLKQSLKVVLVYLTVAANPEGELTYHPDIYERDKSGLQLLRTPVQ